MSPLPEEVLVAAQRALDLIEHELQHDVEDSVLLDPREDLEWSPPSPDGWTFFAEGERLHGVCGMVEVRLRMHVRQHWRWRGRVIERVINVARRG